MVSRGVRIWIASLCALVFAMVVIGGVTRLTRSGLSIVEWQPIAGIVPPLTDQAWHEAFDAYKAYPEYQHVNRGMTLDEFKGIFFWEYLHRLIGRLMGLVLGAPLIVLAWRRALTKPLLKRLIVVFLLGGLQGLVGWYMVKSGLVNMPRVSHYRLATHLAMAFFLFAYLYWTWLDLRARPAPTAGESRRGLARVSVALTALVAVQILYGAFVAGLRAGYGFNTFPLMDGSFVPKGAWMMTPTWINFFENPATVQFVHRVLAWTLLVAVTLYWRATRRLGQHDSARRAASLLALAVTGQFALGVVTLLTVVPVALGALHQVGAFLVLAAAVHANYVMLTDGQRSTLRAASTP